MMMMEVPPLEIKGNGCPDTGKTPVTMHMCTRACATIITARPMMSNAGKARWHLLAT